mgnify:CR=1 FL=1
MGVKMSYLEEEFDETIDEDEKRVRRWLQYHHQIEWCEDMQMISKKDLVEMVVSAVNAHSHVEIQKYINKFNSTQNRAF